MAERIARRIVCGGAVGSYQTTAVAAAETRDAKNSPTSEKSLKVLTLRHVLLSNGWRRVKPRRVFLTAAAALMLKKLDVR